ncbi:MAG: ABC transporter ATP-binding protein [Oscillospiraceae bacterium]|nr:ABC transporter ATP-binding protein [Oscillospiraceae bacterium]
MSEYAIEVENLSISYKGLKSYSIKRNFLLGKRNKPATFLALKDISFRLEKGEILGLVGKNGSGKSTLLKAIAGIFTPDSGTVNLHGNTVTLLAIGVGFQKELSGRENILLSGMLMGFSKKEILSKSDEIIEFSELGEFIDKPVSTYSSGMYSKLSFAITAILETDIILIDEVLSVGDARFKKKSYQKMKELIGQKNRTVIIASHDRKAVAELCDKVLWINDSQLMQIGETAEVLRAYDAFMD